MIFLFPISIVYFILSYAYSSKVTTIKNESKVESFLIASKYLLKQYKKPEASYLPPLERTRLSAQSHSSRDQSIETTLNLLAQENRK